MTSTWHIYNHARTKAGEAVVMENDRGTGVVNEVVSAAGGEHRLLAEVLLRILGCRRTHCCHRILGQVVVVVDLNTLDPGHEDHTRVIVFVDGLRIRHSVQLCGQTSKSI